MIPEDIEGMEFVGYLLPVVKMIFARPTTGYEYKFVPLYKRTDSE